jgi:hypothetical protein
MDMRKLRGAYFRVRYSFLRLIAAIEDVLETYQEMGLIGRLTCWRPEKIAHPYHKPSSRESRLADDHLYCVDSATSGTILQQWLQYS